MSDQTPPQDQTTPDPNEGNPEGAGNLQELSQPDPNVTERKSDYDVALEVIEGKWGSGQVRRNRLHAAGYDFRQVDKEINLLRNP